MKLLYRKDGPIDGSTSGWELVTDNGKAGSKLIGPIIDTKDLAFSFMKISFDYRTAGNNYAGVFFCDQAGDTNTDDYIGLDPSETFTTCTKVFYGREKEVTTRPFFQFTDPMETRNLQIETVSPEAAATWCDHVYQQLPQLQYSPPSERLKFLPRTVDALENGQPWRVVLLGDSIINDTFCSNFQALIKRRYPNSDFKFINSVHGSTGCPIYQQQEKFNEYVLSYQPDLLIIGGVSNLRESAIDEAISHIAKVTTMAREQAGAEVMLLSGPLGRAWKEFDASCIKEDPDRPYTAPQAFWEAMAAFAADFQVEFQNQGTIWRNYLATCGVCPAIFHRDRNHANIRGEQIVGRILAAYFS